MSDETTVEVPSFIVNLIGRLVAENEALKAGLSPVQSVVVTDTTDTDTPPQSGE